MSKAGNQQTTEPETQATGAGASIWGRISQAIAPRPAAQTGTQAAQRPGPGLGRMAIGLVAYMVGSMALEYLLLFVSNIFHLNLPTETQTLFPKSWPLVGSMTKFALLYLMLLLAYVWLLFRLNVIPRDMFRPRNAAARATTTTTTVTTGRSKSAQKRAAAAATTKTTKTATNTTAAKLHLPTRRSGAAARAARSEANATVVDTSGKHDDEYDRVRDLMRRRRKR